MNDGANERAVEAVAAFLLQETDTLTPEFAATVRRIATGMYVRNYAPEKQDEHWIVQAGDYSAVLFANENRKPLIEPGCPPMAVLALAMRISVMERFREAVFSLELCGRTYNVCHGEMTVYPDRSASYFFARAYFVDFDGHPIELGKEEEDLMIRETRFGPHDDFRESCLTVAGEEIMRMDCFQLSREPIRIDPRDPFARHKLAFVHHLSMVNAGRTIMVRLDQGRLSLQNGALLQSRLPSVDYEAMDRAFKVEND